jgi:hypothetical protein
VVANSSSVQFVTVLLVQFDACTLSLPSSPAVYADFGGRPEPERACARSSTPGGPAATAATAATSATSDSETSA